MSMRATLICGFSLIFGVSSITQEPHVLPIEDAIKTHALGEMSPLALSPDGRFLAYMVQDNQRLLVQKEPELATYLRTGVNTRSRQGDLWLTDTNTGRTRSLTNELGSNWDPVWSPDGRYLAFLSDVGEDEQTRVWVWDVAHDRLRQASDVVVRSRGAVDSIQWMPDSKRLLVPILPLGMSVNAYANKIMSSTKAHDGEQTPSRDSTVHIFDAVSQNSADGLRPAPVNLDMDYLHDLAIVDIENGTSRAIVRDRRIRSFCPSPDGNLVAYTEPKPSEKWPISNLVIVNLTTLKEQTIASDVRINNFSWSPGGRKIAYGAYSADGHQYDYYVAGINGEFPQRVSFLPPGTPNCCQIGNPAWDPKGNAFYFVFEGALWRTLVFESQTTRFASIPRRTIRFRSWRANGLLWESKDGTSTIVVAHDDVGMQDGIYRIDLQTGASTQLLEQGQCYTCKWAVDVNSYILASSARSEKMAFVAEDAQHAPDIWLTEGGRRGTRKLTSLNPQFDGYVFGEAKVIDWLSDDGQPLYGALLLPAGYEKNRRYPLIVWSYPNTPLSNRYSYFGMYPGPFNAQLFATRGYAVLFADTARSENQPVDGLAKSVLPGVNRVIELGIADPDRIGLMGHSNGGFATLALITKTRRFKAAVAASGYGDFVGLYGAMRVDGASLGYLNVEALLGDGGPSQNPQRFFENSPLFELNRIDTPLLLVHGTRDDEIASFLSDEVFGDLRLLGKQVEYLRYEGESHAPQDWSYANQLDVSRRVIAWFDKYLQVQPDMTADK